MQPLKPLRQPQPPAALREELGTVPPVRPPHPAPKEQAHASEGRSAQRRDTGRERDSRRQRTQASVSAASWDSASVGKQLRRERRRGEECGGRTGCGCEGSGGGGGSEGTHAAHEGTHAAHDGCGSGGRVCAADGCDGRGVVRSRGMRRHRWRRCTRHGRGGPRGWARGGA